MYAWWPRPTAIPRRRCAPVVCARISITDLQAGVLEGASAARAARGYPTSGRTFHRLLQREAATQGHGDRHRKRRARSDATASVAGQCARAFKRDRERFYFLPFTGYWAEELPAAVVGKPTSSSLRRVRTAPPRKPPLSCPSALLLRLSARLSPERSGLPMATRSRLRLCFESPARSFTRRLKNTVYSS